MEDFFTADPSEMNFKELADRAREALVKSPSEFLRSPMAQDEEEFPAHTEVCKGNPDEVLRHWVRKSDDSDLISASLSISKKPKRGRKV